MGTLFLIELKNFHSDLSFAKETGDVTGGMLGKLKEIKNYSVQGWIINGRFPKRIEKILKNKGAKGTEII